MPNLRLGLETNLGLLVAGSGSFRFPYRRLHSALYSCPPQCHFDYFLKTGRRIRNVAEKSESCFAVTIVEGLTGQNAAGDSGRESSIPRNPIHLPGIKSVM
jgi:hypothetical protein